MFNGDGLRVAVADSTGTRSIIWDGQAYLLETAPSGMTTAVYTNEPTPYGGLISQYRDGQPSFYHPDALGSAQLLTDGSGSVTDSYCNTAYGTPVSSGRQI